MDTDLTTAEQSEALRTRIVTLCTYLPDAELNEAIDTMIASLRHNGGRFTYAQHATLTAMIKRLSVKRHMEKVQDANT